MTEPADVESALLDLLVAWEDARAARRSVAPEEVCEGHPHLLDEFRRRAARVAALDPLLARAGLAPEPPRPEIPGFDLDEPIGQGGMGVVYRGRDRALGRVVAVKLPVGACGTAAARRRFEREGRTLARLRHPNIVPIHSAGVAAFTPYLVMDYVPGGHLGHWVSRPVSPDRVADALEQVCRAVDHAHRAGVVHRDLKPSNVLLDEHDRPMVSDFGVAALLADEPPAANSAADRPAPDRPADGTPPTATRGARGTPAYTAPEQRRPDPGPFEPTADVWSLGVILYELLTGRRPFPDDAPADRPPVPARSIRPAVPAGLERIARRCLERSPADRYPSAAAVADALRAWRAGRRTRARRLAACAGLLAAAALGVVGFAPWADRGAGPGAGRVGSALGAGWFGPEARYNRQAAAAVAELRARGKLDLLVAGADGRALAVKRYGGEAADLRQDENGFGIDTTRDCSAVEFLPAVPAERYTVRATVVPGWLRNNSLLFGVVCRCGAFDTEQGHQNYVHGLFVSSGSGGGSTTAFLEQRWYGQGPGPPNTFVRALRPAHAPGDLAALRRVFGGALRPGGEVWELTVRVTPERVTGACARCDGAAADLGPITAERRADFLRRAGALYPDARPFEERAANGSGVGVVVGYGACTVREFTIELD